MKKFMKLIGVLFLVLALAAPGNTLNMVQASNSETRQGSSSIKNIIYMIGDGMGDGALDAGRLERPTLYMDTIETKGYVTTHNSDNIVTDSAAAGTALATGHKTKYGVVGLLPDGTEVMNAVEAMQLLGKKTGIVSSSYINDATPATFVAHTKSRNNYGEITKAFVESGVDLILGGGWNQFNSRVTLDDGTHTYGIEYATTVGGYQYVTTKADMETVTSGKLLGLFTKNYLNYATARPTTEPDLDDLTTKALLFLENNEEGFFVMIEGGNIDHAGHSNLPQQTISEVVEFDDAVKVAMDYVDAHQDTLLVITSDHETGGVKVVNGEVTYSGTNHTGANVRYCVYGPETKQFEGLTDNTQIVKTIMSVVVAGDKTAATSILQGKTYKAKRELETIEIADKSAKYAVIKYKNSVAGLSGKLDDSLVQYKSDGKWHISDVIELEEESPHSFQPFSSIVSGASIEIAYVAFFDTYEAAAGAQVLAVFNDKTPQLIQTGTDSSVSETDESVLHPASNSAVPETGDDIQTGTDSSVPGTGDDIQTGTNSSVPEAGDNIQTGTNSSVPEMGDMSSVGTLMALLVVAFIGIICIYSYKRKITD